MISNHIRVFTFAKTSPPQVQQDVSVPASSIPSARAPSPETVRLPAHDEEMPVPIEMPSAIELMEEDKSTTFEKMQIDETAVEEKAQDMQPPPAKSLLKKDKKKRKRV